MKLIKIENVNGNLVVSSRVVAEQLGKRHSDVLNKIKEVCNEREFSLVEYTDAKGESRPELLLTKDGFILLCMNYQGYNDFKRAYINKFNEMENALKAPMTPLDILKMQVQLMEEQQKQITEVKEIQSIQSKEIARLENNIRRTQTSNHLTIIAFANINGIKPNRYVASVLGRKATKLSIEKDVKMGSVVDSRYGNIKTYATEILEEVFYNEGLFNK